MFAVFQPHLFSRTQDQAEEFGRALLGADLAVVTDVYASREKPIPGVTGELVVEAARRSGHRNVHYCPSWQDAPELLRGEVGAGDVVITLGAGDVNRLAQALVEEGRPSEVTAAMTAPPPPPCPWPPARAGGCSTSGAAARRPRRRRKSLLVRCSSRSPPPSRVVALPPGLVAWVLTAPLFQLRDVDVRPVKGTPPAASRPDWVRQALAPLQGKNLVRLSLAEAAARLRRNPWIDAVEIAEGAARPAARARRRAQAGRPAARRRRPRLRRRRRAAPSRRSTPPSSEAARRRGLLVVSFARAPLPRTAWPRRSRWRRSCGRVEPELGGEAGADRGAGRGGLPAAHRRPALPPAGQARARSGPKVRRLVELLPELSAPLSEDRGGRPALLAPDRRATSSISSRAQRRRTGA